MIRLSDKQIKYLHSELIKVTGGLDVLRDDKSFASSSSIAVADVWVSRIIPYRDWKSRAPRLRSYAKPPVCWRKQTHRCARNARYAKTKRHFFILYATRIIWYVFEAYRKRNFFHWIKRLGSFTYIEVENLIFLQVQINIHPQSGWIFISLTHFSGDK